MNIESLPHRKPQGPLIPSPRQEPRHPTLGRPMPSASLTNFKHHLTSCRILTAYPSLTLFSLSLGSTNPGWINLPQETLGFRWICFSQIFSLLIPTYSLLSSPALLTVRLQRNDRTLLYHLFWTNPK